MQTPLHRSVIYCAHKVCRTLLIQDKIDPLCKDIEGNTALHLACKKGCLWCVIELTKSVTSIECSDRNAIKSINIPQDRFVTNNSGHTCFHLAIINGHTTVVRYLLEICNYDKDVNYPTSDDNGYTPMHLSVIHGHKTITRDLLKVSNVKPKVKDNFGRIAMDYYRDDANCQPDFELLYDDMLYQGKALLYDHENKCFIVKNPL